MAAKAKATSIAVQTIAQAGVKAIVGGAKSKLAAAPVLAGPVVADPVVVAAPTIPLPPVVPASITNVKVFKSAPPRIAPRPLPVEQWKPSLPKGWDSSLSYGHPLYGYGFTRSAVELRKEAVSSNAAFDSKGNMTPLMLKQIFAYVSGHDSERCVLRVVCEVAAEPNLAGPQGNTVAEFMTDLSRKDRQHPLDAIYRDAAIAGQVSANPSQCRERYPSCTKSTESLVEVARSRISQASEIAAPAA